MAGNGMGIGDGGQVGGMGAVGKVQLNKVTQDIKMRLNNLQKLPIGESNKFQAQKGIDCGVNQSGGGNSANIGGCQQSDGGN